MCKTFRPARTDWKSVLLIAAARFQVGEQLLEILSPSQRIEIAISFYDARMTVPFGYRLANQVHGPVGIVGLKFGAIRGRKLAIVAGSGRGSAEDAGDIVNEKRLQVVLPGHGLCFVDRPRIVSLRGSRGGPVDPSIHEVRSALQITSVHGPLHELDRLAISGYGNVRSASLVGASG